MEHRDGSYQKHKNIIVEEIKVKTRIAVLRDLKRYSAESKLHA